MSTLFADQLDPSGEYIIRVDEDDIAIGTIGKMQGHEIGCLHRAFSVFLCNDQQQLLIQQRALVKYHSPGLWANSCCGHPRPHEGNRAAATRRIEEELGITTTVREMFTHRYHADVGGGLIENEFVHMFFGRYTQHIHPNPSEVAAVKWVSLDELKRALDDHPAQFTAWFQIYLRSCFDDIARGLAQCAEL
jgi:isopentenyl-diphosphate Delta-isomerase